MPFSGSHPAAAASYFPVLWGIGGATWHRGAFGRVAVQEAATTGGVSTAHEWGEGIAFRKSSAFPLARKVICALTLLVSDLITIAAAMQCAILAQIWLLPRLDPGSPRFVFAFGQYALLVWVWLLPPMILASEGLYTQRSTLWKEIGQLTKATCMSVATMLAAVALGKLSSDVSRMTIVLAGVNLFFLLPVSRYFTKRALGTVGLWRKHILILGATDMARLALRELDGDWVFGYQVIGCLDNDPSKHGLCMGRTFGKPVNVLGPLALASDLMRRNKARDILIAMPGLSEDRTLELVHELQPLCETIYLVPNLWALPMMNLQLDGFLEQQVRILKVSNNLAKPWNVWLKRSFDLVLSGVLTVVALPLMGLVALMIKLDSKGPLLFAQKRLGFRDNDFRCLKFSSMYRNGEEILVAYLQQNPHLADEWRKYAKLKMHDPRLTRVGKFLRRWSLDEIPQIFNVLKGEMSLVGPRPYLPGERERIGPHLATILQARPGMTGFWQVSGKNDLTFEDRVRLEVWYVRNWSFWLDLIILVKTVKTVLMREGAY